jgi:hypothetical protein
MKLDNVNSLLRLMAQAGPYLAIELVLPGGSVIALLTWLYRRRRKAASVLHERDVRLFCSQERIAVVTSRAPTDTSFGGCDTYPAQRWPTVT